MIDLLPFRVYGEVALSGFVGSGEETDGVRHRSPVAGGR